jgi:hypothetical protein
MRIINIHLALIFSGFGLLAGCEEEPRPRSTAEFLENPIMLEAAMVRCSQDRKATRYDAECVNARQAVGQIEVKEEEARQADFDARSQSKRQALRRTQEAAAQARRRAAEAERLRIEAEYLAQFGVAPPREDQTPGSDADVGNLPTAVFQESEQPAELSSGSGDASLATDGGNAPGVSVEPEVEAPATDLESIRDELQRRNEEGDN